MKNIGGIKPIGKNFVVEWPFFKGSHASLFGSDELNINLPVILKLFWIIPKLDTENFKEFAIYINI